MQNPEQVRGPVTPVPEKFDWQTVAPRYDALLTENVRPENASAWLERLSNIERELSEAWVTAYNASNEDTLNPKAQDAYLHFVREISPLWEMAYQKLVRKALDLQDILPLQNISEAWKSWQNKAEIFREENVPLQAKDTELSNEFDVVRGKQTTLWDGEELSLGQLSARYDEHPDRAIRERAYRMREERKFEDAAHLANTFIKLHALRLEMAKNAGFTDCSQYFWRQLERYDYTPAQTKQFAASVHKYFVPLLRRVYEARRKKLGLETLRPWDLAVGLKNRSPRKPFKDSVELEKTFAQIFCGIDNELGGLFQELQNNQGLELPTRKGKSEGNVYSWYYLKTKRAYVFLNAAGSHSNVMDMLHECGHAFHSLLSLKTQNLIWNCYYPMEFAEVASQSLELLGIPYLYKERGGFYNTTDTEGILEDALVFVLDSLIRKGRDEEFLHWVYGQPTEQLSAEVLNAKRLELNERFDVGIDNTGLEDFAGIAWQTWHTLKFPFYNIEYAIAWFGALQVWQNSLENEQAAIAQYKNALRLGGSKSLPELFKAAGAKFVFDDETVAGVAKLLEEKLVGLLA